MVNYLETVKKENDFLLNRKDEIDKLFNSESVEAFIWKVIA